MLALKAAGQDLFDQGLVVSVEGEGRDWKGK